MANLVLELKPGEMMVINGAPIRFRNKCRIELAAQVRFLFGKQIMAPQDANTPARRIYYALQTAYVGTETERRAAVSELRLLIGMFREATTSKAARLILDMIETGALEDDCYPALKLGRRLIRHEEAVLPAPATTRAGADVLEEA